MPQPQKASRRKTAAGSAGGASRGGTTGTRPSAATVRKKIVEVLADSGEPMSQKEIETKVGPALPSAQRPSIASQIGFLLEDDDATYVPGSRKVKLTEKGERWFRGIRALSPGAIPISLDDARAARDR
jgi:hypothetical protein